MAPIIKFEDIQAWQRARELNKIIYTESNLQAFSKDFALKDQIRKSSISIMSNIAEGFERKSNNEFKYFLNVAKGSAGELRSQLYICFDLNYINKEIFYSNLKKWQEFRNPKINLLNSLIKNLKKNLGIFTIRQQITSKNTTLRVLATLRSARRRLKACLPPFDPPAATQGGALTTFNFQLTTYNLQLK
ncbi:MAG: four helix bundle protein [Bacteroidetes bacterium]|nr:four helix bundle protein [Bacteroidota bacterium]